jgi:hypothetical protein
MSLIPSSKALSKLLSEYNDSSNMNPRDAGHMFRVTILLPWSLVFVAGYIHILDMKTLQNSQTVALLGIGVAILAMLGAYLTGYVYASIRTPFWVSGFFYWLELCENQLSDNECMLLVPAAKRARELARKPGAITPGQRDCCVRVIRRGQAEEQRVRRLYLQGELIRFAEQARDISEAYLKECGSMASVQRLHTACEEAIRSLKTQT